MFVLPTSTAEFELFMIPQKVKHASLNLHIGTYVLSELLSDTCIVSVLNGHVGVKLHCWRFMCRTLID